MKPAMNTLVLQATGAQSAQRLEVIQSLWSGYGEIVRIQCQGGIAPTAVLKYVVFPTEHHHPRGWHSDIGHARKVKSYEVEMAWYANFSARCDDLCRVPHCYDASTIFEADTDTSEEHIMVLEDLDAVGYPIRKTQLSQPEIETCLHWLANFHATFLNETPNGLWAIGTYWHLDTRPDELAAMTDHSLQQVAGEIDERLNQCQFKTLVHGDAKLANFCFSEDGKRVAAVDFQYVGGGCGMKDVVYFLGSCMDEDQCEQLESVLLEVYFTALNQAIKRLNKSVDTKALESEWRTLYPVAWTDFHRFLLGWMPTHWKINRYSRRLASEVTQDIKRQTR